MFTQALTALAPTFIAQWLFLVALACGAWFAWTVMYPKYQFKLGAPLLIASTLAIYSIGNTVVSLYQNYRLGTVRAESEMAANSQQGAQGAQAPVDPVVQLKADFLKNLEALVRNPDQITDENKKKLFGAFGKLFPSGKADRQVALAAAQDAYDCQLKFWEDALASFKEKKAVKSQARKECETKSGAFFNREKLITSEAVKNNDQTIAEIAQRKKRVPAADGKEVDVTEAMLRDAVDEQVRLIYNLKKVFD
ncbi:MAG: hypothetical protein IT289_02225 [Oligoflexia bacterium]|nr:hypothetical protein [Oligoflexia bacterium]